MKLRNQQKQKCKNPLLHDHTLLIRKRHKIIEKLRQKTQPPLYKDIKNQADTADKKDTIPYQPRENHALS